MRYIDTKYIIEGSITKQDGTPIPPDEPLFLFRAQDELLLEVLTYYRALRAKKGASQEALNRMDEQVERIRTWQESHHTQLPLK